MEALAGVRTVGGSHLLSRDQHDDHDALRHHRRSQEEGHEPARGHDGAGASSAQAGERDVELQQQPPPPAAASAAAAVPAMTIDMPTHVQRRSTTGE